MTVTAPINVELQHEGTLASDGTAGSDIARNGIAHSDIVVLDEPVASQVVPVEAVTLRDPAMVLVYLGILSLMTIIAVSAFLAL